MTSYIGIPVTRSALLSVKKICKLIIMLTTTSKTYLASIMQTF